MKNKGFAQNKYRYTLKIKPEGWNEGILIPFEIQDSTRAKAGRRAAGTATIILLFLQCPYDEVNRAEFDKLLDSDLADRLHEIVGEDGIAFSANLYDGDRFMGSYRSYHYHQFAERDRFSPVLVDFAAQVAAGA